ncbi:hypothetical protein ONZ43_g6066 [Nemania bipapillata]|uniref:Uncharacterized protein n=1 Tax=Nemania bipapillata TaxID=110536 RepID=A0ACC2I2X6_9PEZI|nr:hypothetical protein ONZ43_g6066 [Nemania bipapillata]
MKTAFVIATLLASLVAASPTGNGNVPAYDPRDITADGLWKRWCDGSPVADPICPHGAFWSTDNFLANSAVRPTVQASALHVAQLAKGLGKTMNDHIILKVLTAVS